MKIALLTQGFRTFAPEASNITLMILAEELSKKGHEVIIFCNQILKQPLIEKINGYKVVRQKSDYNSRYKSAMQLLNFSKMIKKEVEQSGKEFDVIHNFSASPILAIRAVLAKKHSKNAKLIQTIRARTNFYLSYLLTPLLNKFDFVVVPTNSLRKTLIRFGLNPIKIKLISSYIDINKFKPRDKNALKRKYRLNNKKILLYYGHMSESKGIYNLIDAIELIKDEDFIALFITGSGENFIQPYERAVRKKNLQNKIKIIKTPVKKTRNIEEYVAMADAVVLPYPNLISTEAQPSCVIESMASKTQLITTDIKELKELVSGYAILAKPCNTESLAAKIKEFLRNGPDKRMIEKAHKKALEFDYRRVIGRYLDIYSE